MLLVILSVVAGVVVARWWAVLVALACLAMGAGNPRGAADAGSAVEITFGVEIS